MGTGTEGFLLASAGSGAMSSVGAARDSQNKKASLEYQAGIAAQNKRISDISAADALVRGKEEADSSRRDFTNLKSQIKVEQGASGLRSDDVDAVAILVGADIVGLEERGIILDNAEKEAWSKRVDAANFEADSSVLSARASRENPALAGFTSLLGSGMSTAGKWYGAKLSGGTTTTVRN